MGASVVVNARVVVPPAAVETRAVRSSGPGGQNVNKTATKIQMWIDLAALEGLEPGELDRMRAFLASRLDARGRLLVSSQETRDQARNLEDAARRAGELLRAALKRPAVRRRTRPTRSSVEKRLRQKRRRTGTLANRRLDE